MHSKTADFRHPHLWAILILLTGLAVTWLTYAPGMGGQLHFDDYHNLDGLAEIADAESSFDFVINGTAGPLGRPLALASFVPEAYAWPDTPSVFLRTNIAIHLINGLLVAWFLYLLGRAREVTDRPAAIAAAVAASTWMLMPLLASSSLFIVQRMTTISASFALLGAVGYMHARLSIQHRPASALAGMTFFLGVGGLLAVFAKENGALVFLFILAAEATLLKRPNSVPAVLWRGWFTLVLLAPLAALIVFLLSAVPYPEETVLRRGFTGLERLATQAEILWKYLYLAFVPNIADLGPYHDGYPVRRDFLDLVTILSAAGWAALIAAAIKFRHKWPLLGFAVAWYLLGHLLESTVLSLELYFEHRNYLPLIGPVYALVASFERVSKTSTQLCVLGFGTYFGVLATVLFSVTSLWGSPTLAAELWHIYNPTSTRAMQNLVGELQKQGDLFASRRVLNRFITNNATSEALRLQILIISCQLEPHKDHREYFETTLRDISDAHFIHSTALAFAALHDLVREHRCPSIEVSDIQKLGPVILANPYFSDHVARHNIHITLADIGIDSKNFSLTMKHMEAALDAKRNTATLAKTIKILTSAGREDIAREFLAETKLVPAPLNPLAAWKWNRDLAKLESLLSNLDTPDVPTSLNDKSNAPPKQR